MASKLEQLRAMTVVVADTGDIDSIKALKPVDCTTNPSLLLKAAEMPAYDHLIAEAVSWGSKQGGGKDGVVAAIADRLAVSFGAELTKLVPGRVSTEVDADLSFDTQATIAKAHAIIADYKSRGIERDRILIKIASTWEGIQAARVLQSEGVRCNMTLLFSLEQAIACAEARVQLISPFVGRIYDWYKKSQGTAWDEAANAGRADPGVQSVRRIYDHYKRAGVPTEIMGASFRNAGQILALAGCDLLTISPELLGQLQAAEGGVPRQLTPPGNTVPSGAPLGEADFRFALNENAMANDKLAEGIRAFVADARKLDGLLEAA